MRLLTLLWLLAIPAFAQAPTPGPYLGLTKYTALIVRDYVSAGTFIGDGSQLTGISGTSGGGASPSLPLNGVQYNNAGNFGANVSFTFVGGLLTVPTVSASAFNGNGAGLTNVAAANVPYAGISGIPAPLTAVATGTALTMQDLSTTTLSATTADILTLQSGLVSTTALSATTALLTNLTVTACTGCSAGGGTQISTTSNNNASNISNSTAIGFNASAGTGTENTTYGSGAGRSITSGFQDTGIGAAALASVTTGANNVGIGSLALTQLTTANHNTAVGHAAFGGAVAYNAADGTAIGWDAGLFATGAQNTILGSAAGNNVSFSGTANLIGGYAAAQSLTSGIQNVILGQSAASNLTTGSSNIAIGGKSVNLFSATGSNQLSIGNIIYGDLGRPLAGFIGINITSPSVAWEVSGTISATTVTVNSPTTLPTCTAAKAGNMWYNGITKCLNYCDGTANRQVTSVAASCT